MPIYSVCSRAGEEAIFGVIVYFEGGDVDSMSSKIEAREGQPADRVEVRKGYRVWVWESTSPQVELTSYSMGVSVKYVSSGL